MPLGVNKIKSSLIRLAVWPNTKYRNLQSNISSWSRDFNTCMFCLVIRTYRTNTDSWVPQQQHVLERASQMKKFRTLQSGYENALPLVLSTMQSGNIYGSMTRILLCYRLVMQYNITSDTTLTEDKTYLCHGHG